MRVMATAPLAEPLTAQSRPLWAGREGATKSYSSRLVVSLCIRGPGLRDEEAVAVEFAEVS